MAARFAVRRRVSFADGNTALFKLVLVLAFVTALPRGAWPQSKFVSETADGSPNDLGFYTSLALDAQGNPHVSYRDATIFVRELKYARKSGGAWTTETVAGAGDRGFHSSLALDASGNPHVSYLQFFTGSLEYARKSGGIWTIETAGGAGSYAEYTSLALDAQGNPHVSYHDATNSELKYARKSGGVWTIETAEPGNFAGFLYTSLALDAQGNPHVSYRDQSFGTLKYARKSGSFWTIETVDGPDTGYWTSLALDAQGNPHVSYVNGSTIDLKYARKSGGVWTIETGDGSANNVGSFCSLALDASGNPHVSYSDDDLGDLKYARKSGGVWMIETADGSADYVGAWTSIALDAQGNPHVSYRDATTGDLKYADAAVHVANPSAGVTWAVGSLQEVRWSGVGPVSILLSLDGGSTHLTLLEATQTSPLAIRVPHAPSRFARIKILRESPLSIASSDSFFRIDATIALNKFDAASRDGDAAVALSWKTTPGPEAEVRYRVERASETIVGDTPSFAPIHAGLLDRGEYLDAAPRPSARYRLIAVNGLGEEYVLGEAATAAALRSGRLVTAYPNPSRGGGADVAYRVTAGDFATTVTVYDASGRLVRRLESGTFPTGVRSVRWDGRDERGGAVGAGAYFVRVRSGTGAEGVASIRVVP